MNPAAVSTDTPGRVAVNFGNHCLVETPDGDLLRCHVPRRLARPVCGDRVRWQATGPDEGQLTRIETRRNELLRHDARASNRVLASNLDCILLVLAAKPEPDLPLIDRYLVAAELLGLDARLVFNKDDLLDETTRKHWQQTLRVYAGLGYPLVFTSVRKGQGLTRIRDGLAGKTCIVAGQSGVGKSSLVSILVPDLELRTQKLSRASGAGQHTTSTTRLYPVPGLDACIIDSPGVRDFRLWPLQPAELVRGFREFAGASALCRFTDCRHLQEPGCEIHRRVEAAEISTQRYASYRQLAEWTGMKKGAGSPPARE